MVLVKWRDRLYCSAMKSYTATRIERCPVPDAISAIFCPFQRDIRGPCLTARHETQYQTHNLYCTSFEQDQAHRLLLNL